MGGGSGGGSSGAGWTLILLPAVDGEVLAEYWTDTNATPVEITAGQSAKISASKIYLSIMCDGEPVSVLDIPVLFDGSTAKYDTQNECYTLSASSGTHTVQVGTVTLTISPGTVGSMRPGDTATFKATVSPANLSVIWSVDGPGNLAGNGLTATYTATQAGAVQVAAAVDMTNAGSSVSFTVSEPIVKIRRHRMRDDGTYEVEHHETGAEQVIFSDGETFQAKLDAGKLTGKDGKEGTPGKDGINGKSAYQQAVAAGYTGTEAAFYAALVSMKDAPFLPLSGGAVSGLLTVLGTIWLDATHDAYIRSSEGELILSAGSVDALKIYDGEVKFPYGGNIKGVNAPVNPADAANKAYVDAETAMCLPLAGGTMTGDLNVEFNGINLAYGTRIFTSGDIEDLCIMANSGICFYDKNWGRASLNNVRRIYGLEAPTGADQAANKAYVDEKQLVFAGKTVAVSAWAANTTYSAQGYAYRASVACTGVTTFHRPDVAFGAADAVGGNFAPVADSYAGGVYIYCKTKPTATITIPSIVCVKGA